MLINLRERERWGRKKEKVTRLLPYTIYKIDYPLKCKFEQHKTPTKTIFSNLFDITLSNIFLYVSSGKENKRKNKQMRLH